MTFTQIFETGAPIASFVTAAVVVLATHRTSSAKVWREEAEAQKARADRLQDDMDEIKERLTRIENENKRLIELLTALAPERINSLRH
ncbi:hypothetical protein ACFTZI_20775 [Streptomyces decoyicus]|uniref:hypothetical protein n=1 Tax=Streptomyces decoyicus TaxID=249567 RepID=UPI0036410E7D